MVLEVGGGGGYGVDGSCVGGIGDELLVAVGDGGIEVFGDHNEDDEEDGDQDLNDVADDSSFVEQPVFVEEGG